MNESRISSSNISQCSNNAKDKRQPTHPYSTISKGTKYISPFILEAQKLAKQRATNKAAKKTKKPVSTSIDWDSNNKTSGFFDPSIRRAEVIPKKAQFITTRDITSSPIKTKYQKPLGDRSPGSVTSEDLLEKKYLRKFPSVSPVEKKYIKFKLFCYSIVLH